jgi:hypothetical protein
MTHKLSSPLLLKTYTFIVILSIASCLYVFLRPGIRPPIYPANKLTSALQDLGSSKLVTTTSTHLNKDSSDRTISPIYTYNYSNNSKLLATMVRVRKRDEFKIETYGLLTKNIEPIYLKNSMATPGIPPSLSGTIGKDTYLQTCIVPKSTRIEEADFRLNNLTSIVERLSPSSSSSLDKLLGNKKIIDYSCLVLTFKSSSQSKDQVHKNWRQIISNVQKALSS